MTYVDCKALVIVRVLTSYTTVIKKVQVSVIIFIVSTSSRIRYSILLHSVKKHLVIIACMR